MKLSKTLYHGSIFDLRALKPKRSRVLGNEKALFATPHRGVALAFASQSWSDDEIELARINGRLFLKELRPNAFKVFDAAGYLYSFTNNASFRHDPRLTNFELFSDNPVRIFDKIRYENILVELRNCDDITLVDY